MKRFLNKRVIILVWVAVFVLCIPSSLAKYYKTDTLEYSVKYHYSPDPPIVYKTNAVKTNDNDAYVQTPSDMQTVTIEKDGYYQIIAKGGDGGSGYSADGSTKKTTIPGGTGGFVSVKVALKKNDVLSLYIGHKGGDAYMKNGMGNSGYAGTVHETDSTYKTSYYGSMSNNDGRALGNGGQGGNGSAFGATTLFSMNVASGGGGAATSVYLGNAISNKIDNLLCVAGGGGSGACWNQGYSYPNGGWAVFIQLISVPAGLGGQGGSNVINSPSPVSGYENIFAGKNGYLGSFLPDSGDNSTSHLDGGRFISRPSSSVQTFGGGGTNKGGSAAGQIAYSGMIPSSGKAGSDIANNGTGASSNTYAGAGGGGYCGGGSGSGASLEYSAGGGGGGSSYINSGLGVTSYEDYSSAFNDLNPDINLSIKSDLYEPWILVNHKKSASASNNHTVGDSFSIDRVYNGNNLQSEGFVIVKYLGPIT